MLNNENFIKKSVLGKRQQQFDEQHYSKKSDSTEKMADSEITEMPSVSPSFGNSSDFIAIGKHKQEKESKITDQASTYHKVITRHSTGKQSKYNKKEKSQHKSSFSKPRDNKMKKVHCICNSTRYTWWRKGDMIQCCQCLVWFHYSCLCLSKLPDHREENFLFECGLEHCPSNIFWKKQENDKKPACKTGNAMDGINENIEKENEISKEQFLSAFDLKRVSDGSEPVTEPDTQENVSFKEILNVHGEINAKHDLKHNSAVKENEPSAINRLSLKRKADPASTKRSQLDVEKKKIKQQINEIKTNGTVLKMSNDSDIVKEHTETVTVKQKKKQAKCDF